GAAGLLVPTASAWWGAASSLILLAAFTVAVAVNLSRGRAPDCRCFGQVSATPIGPSTLVRNLVLASGATLLLVMGPGATPGAVVDRWAGAPTSERLTWFGAVALIALLVKLARPAERFRARTAPPAVPEWQRDAARGLPVGAPAPPFDLPLLAGDHASIETLTRDGAPVLLVFGGSNCAACAGLWPDIERWQRDHRAALRIAVVGIGRPQSIEMKLMGNDVQDVLLADDTRLLEAYQVPRLPAAVVVRPDGTVGSKTASDPAAIRELVAARVGARS
ncbi:MAG: MauE/DoxX family redox-associated membrane protein, partial [Vicinamibacterales bacterium]